MQSVRIKNLSKVYKLYHNQTDRLKESLHPLRKKYHQAFFALHDVSFDVKRGETLGIIGKNGSGKSTLLKIIAGILTPTSGDVAVSGKVSALLELGAGFNPDMTGIENIYFSGTIMGFTRKEMDERIDAVSDFADIGDFIDQAVKTYSSGMFIRLAFAVAINVDPDILIIDEALAVGDMNFQAKCFRRLNNFRKQGKTVIIVTHALDSIIRYCDKAIVLDSGRKIIESSPREAVDVYKRLMTDSYLPESRTGRGKHGVKRLEQNALSYGSGMAEIYDFGLFDESRQPVKLLHNSQLFFIRMNVKFNADVKDPIFAYTIKDLKGLEITGTNTLYKKVQPGSYQTGDSVVVEFTQTLNCQSGRYSLSFGCTGYDNEKFVVYHRLYDVLFFEVIAEEPMVGFYDLDSQIVIAKVD